MSDYQVPDGCVLVLRTCESDLTSCGGFRWPETGDVSDPDWDPEPRCGNGLHGLLWGEGDGGLMRWERDARWLVVEVCEADIVDLGGKVKFGAGRVVHCGDRESATAFLVRRAPRRAVVGATVTAGDGGTATAGDRGTATAGDRGTATAGDYGTAVAGYRGTATAGYRGTATAGDRGTASAGDRGTATAGDYGAAVAGYRGTASAGYGGTAVAGYGGTASAGYRGTAVAGYGGTASAGYRGTASAGYRGTLILRRWDGERYRTHVAYVGEDGIEPNVPYRLDDEGRFVKAKLVGGAA